MTVCVLEEGRGGGEGGGGGAYDGKDFCKVVGSKIQKGFCSLGIYICCSFVIYIALI